MFSVAQASTERSTRILQIGGRKFYAHANMVARLPSMTDSTDPPYAEPPRERYSFRVPQAVAGAVHVWAAEMGISDNAAWCLLLRAGLIHAIDDPAWLPPAIAIRDRDAAQVKRNVTLPVRLAELLETWAAEQSLYRDVAATILLSASLLDAQRVGLPHLTLPETITQEARA
jgi:hypothetical protein